jgi:hypothetical protein
MSLILFYPFAMPWKSGYWYGGETRPFDKNSDVSFCNALEEWLLIWWWNKTFWQKQWCNSDETVMEQWYDSYASSFLTFAKFWNVIDCIISFNNPNDTRAFHNISDETVMEQWCNSDRTVMPLIWALLCHFQAFEMSLIIFYPFTVPWVCAYWSIGETRPFKKYSDQTVMEQWCNSDATVMPLI